MLWFMYHIWFTCCPSIIAQSPASLRSAKSSQRSGLSDNVLTLSSALQQALENNFDIKIARNLVLQAEHNAEGLYGFGNAGMLPNLNINASFIESRSNVFQRRSDTQAERDVPGIIADRFNAAAQLDWTLFNGLRMFATLDRLKELNERSKLALRQSIENTTAQVMMAYYAIVQQQTQYRALRTVLERSRERLTIAQAKEGIGAGSQLEVMRAKVDLNADSAALLRQGVVVRNAKAALHVLLTKKADDTAVDAMSVQDSLVINTALLRTSYKDLLAQAERSNSLLRDLKAAEQVASAAAREAESVYFPTINLTAGYNFVNIQDQASIFSINRFYGLSYGLTAQWTLFNGFNNDRQAQNARLDVGTAQLQYNDALTSLDGSLAQAFRTFRNSVELVKLEEENLGIAQETVRIGLERFRLGALTSLDLREIQLNALAAETRLVQARFEAKAAEIEIMRLTGQLVSAQ